MRPAPAHTLLAALCIMAIHLALSPFPGMCAVFPVDKAEDDVLGEIGVDERLGARLPLDAPFTDSSGASVRLGDYFKDKPVILTLNYYECPMLCPLTFRNLADTFAGMGGLVPGRDYRVVTVSFNPDDTPALAASKAGETYRMLKGVSDPSGAWVFLTGGPESIKSLTGAAGYRYKKLEGQYAHPAAVMVITPDGVVSRYLYGLSQDPMDMRLALIEASGGKVGPSGVLNRVLLFCYHYDPAGRKYALAATRIMTGLGVVTLIIVGGMLLAMWARERKAGHS